MATLEPLLGWMVSWLYGGKEVFFFLFPRGGSLLNSRAGRKGAKKKKRGREKTKKKGNVLIRNSQTIALPKQRARHRAADRVHDGQPRERAVLPRLEGGDGPVGQGLVHAEQAVRVGVVREPRGGLAAAGRLGDDAEAGGAVEREGGDALEVVGHVEDGGGRGRGAAEGDQEEGRGRGCGEEGAASTHFLFFFGFFFVVVFFFVLTERL